MSEIFDLNVVKQEFLQNLGGEYSTIFSERQLEMSVYMLNEFCTALTANGLVLLRQQQQQPLMQQQPPMQMQQPRVMQQPPQDYRYQQYQQPPVQPMSVPPQYQNIGSPATMPDPFQEEQEEQFLQQQQVKRQVTELNAQLPKAQPIDLSPDKPKSFAEKIKEMRSTVKRSNRINPDDDN